MKIYTKTGDKGMTSLVGGTRVKKSCVRLDCYGGVDELNSFTGLLITHCDDCADRAFLENLQKSLFVVGGYLATDVSTTEVRCCVTADMITDVEHEIDRLSAMLQPLTCFIIPGGNEASSLAHVCRTVCRRVERSVFALIDEGAEVDSAVTSYLNRLSDYFFVLARKLSEC